MSIFVHRRQIMQSKVDPRSVRVKNGCHLANKVTWLNIVIGVWSDKNDHAQTMLTSLCYYKVTWLNDACD